VFQSIKKKGRRIIFLRCVCVCVFVCLCVHVIDRSIINNVLIGRTTGMVWYGINILAKVWTDGRSVGREREEREREKRGGGRCRSKNGRTDKMDGSNSILEFIPKIYTSIQKIYIQKILFRI